METMTDFIFLGSKITADGDYSQKTKRQLLLGRKAMTNLDCILKKQRHYFAHEGVYSQSYGFSGSQIWMWELDHKESWTMKDWCFWTVVLEKTLESSLYWKDWDLVSPNWEINPEYSLEELMLKLKFKYFGHLMGRTDSGKDPDAGKDWRQEEKKMTEDEMVEWHHLLDGHEFEQAQEVGCGWGEGSLVWPSSRHYKEWDTTKRLNRTDVREDARVWSHNSFLWYVPQLSGTCILSYYLLSFLRAHQGECLWFDDC